MLSKKERTTLKCDEQSSNLIDLGVLAKFQPMK